MFGYYSRKFKLDILKMSLSVLFSGTKQQRHVFSPSQKDVLETTFIQSNFSFPSVSRMEDLASRFSLKYSQIFGWYNNRRHRETKARAPRTHRETKARARAPRTHRETKARAPLTSQSQTSSPAPCSMSQTRLLLLWMIMLRRTLACSGASPGSRSSRRKQQNPKRWAGTNVM